MKELNSQLFRAIGQSPDVSASLATLAPQEGDLPQVLLAKIIASIGAAKLADVALTTDTSAYASGDVVADRQVISNATRAKNAPALLQSLMLIDKADQGAALEVLFFSDDVALGTENAAPSISDANALTFLGRVSIATTDYQDLGGAKVAHKTGLSLLMSPKTDTRDIYVAVLNGSGTPTYAADSLVLRLGFLW